MPGSSDRTKRRCSTASRRSIACCLAMSPICSSSGPTWTHSAVAKAKQPPIAQIHWRTAWRIVPSRFPPVGLFDRVADPDDLAAIAEIEGLRLEEHTSELQSLMRISYAVFCLKKKKHYTYNNTYNIIMTTSTSIC